ncbi:MAG TPA: DUF937 domain-containing protein [Thermomicrobiales bacterium]|nr:hypothetical protein [Chloroflexota bacterium]HBY45032.1 hypothetical protein [Chloroflexota bacterium]HQZ90000.1 DUF937 domain-containing protein [Thermomicrobiales bacterium]HRA31192.1 DUF937 domain-containing protein [Thermomicrobiales bacterium]
MASLAEMLVQQVTAAAQTPGQQLPGGVDPQAAQTGLATAVPLLMAALSRNAQSPEGADALHQAIAKDHDGSVLDNLPAYLSNPGYDDGAGIVKHALGGNQSAVEQSMSQTTGLDPAMVAKLLQFAAPLVLGMLAKRQREQSMSANDLSSMLQHEQKQEAGANPDMMDLVSKYLDTNKDGSVVDDLQSLAGKLFGKRQA